MDARRRRHTRYLFPYAVTFVVTWALLGPSLTMRPLELAVALALQLLVAALAWNWQEDRSSTRRYMLGTAAFVVSVGLLRDAGGFHPGVTGLVLLPAVFGAMRQSRTEMLFALAAAAVTLYLPELIIGTSRYPFVDVRGNTFTLLEGVLIGETLLRLIRRLSAAHERERRLTADMRRQLSTEDALRQVATLVAAGAPAPELFSEVSHQLARIAGASIGEVIRFDAETQIGEVVGAWRAGRVVLSGRKLALTDLSPAAQVFRTGRPARLRPYTWPGLTDADGAVAAPILVRGRVWGAANVVFRVGETMPADFESRFAHFSELVAMAIANAENASQLLVQASIDVLTGIPNRRSFEQQLTRDLEWASRHSRPLALVVLDVDHFKTVNDTYGHPAGDTVLAAIAARLSSEARAGEMVARLGGEEFVWLMPDTTAEEAFVAAERARRAVAQLSLEEVGHVTLSAGVSSNLRADTASQLLGRADEALYAAKSRGRDQTVAAPASISSAEDRVNPAAA